MKQKCKKGMAAILSLAMIAGFAPTMLGETGAEEAVNVTKNKPSVYAYATKEQMMDNTFVPDTNGTSTNVGKLVLGKRENEDGTYAQLEWYILGKDNGVLGDNTIIFAADPIKVDQDFEDDYPNDKNYNSSHGTYETEPTQVSTNHYGSSDLRVALQNIIGSSTFFNTYEQNMMNATTITTFDRKNGEDYKTTDKLYALEMADMNSYGHEVINAGSNNQVILGKEKYWNTNDYFWLRTPGMNTTGAFAATPNNEGNSQVSLYATSFEWDIRPASNLNLSSVLFASGASSHTTVGVIPQNSAMTLRFDGSGKNIGAATYNATTGKIEVTRGSTAKDVTLIVQGNSETDNWYYTQKITESKTVSVEDIAKESITPISIDLSKCEIWLEITDTDGLIYAVNATEIKNIASVEIKGFNSPTIGSALDTTALCETKGVKNTTPQITWTPNDSKVKYDTEYTASITLEADENYEFAENTTATVLGKTATSVTKNTDETITVTYAFSAIKENKNTDTQPTDKTPTKKDDNSEIKNKKKPEYKILEGANSNWEKNSKENLLIKGNGELSKFTGIKVDGIFVDVKNYTTKEDLTTILLKPDFLNTLSVGEHSMEIVWTDGLTNTTLTIRQGTTNNEIISPDTGDNTSIAWLIAIMALFAAGLYFAGRKITEYDS